MSDPTSSSHSSNTVAVQTVEPAEPTALPVVSEMTPARLFTGRTGESYLTRTSLSLRRDHAAAADAVHAEVNLARDFSPESIRQFGLFELTTQASSKREFLARPDLGRRFTDESKRLITANCPRDIDLQILIGDGLSATAVATQCPTLLPVLIHAAFDRGWQVGRPFLVRYCRVGLLNEVGSLLAPKVVVLLIGERPGLATAESLSAYLAYRPQIGDTDAQRNLVSNIHRCGVSPDDAVRRVLGLVEQMLDQKTSGTAIKERLTSIILSQR